MMHHLGFSFFIFFPYFTAKLNDHHSVSGSTVNAASLVTQITHITVMTVWIMYSILAEDVFLRLIASQCR